MLRALLCLLGFHAYKARLVGRWMSKDMKCINVCERCGKMKEEA